MAGWFPLFVSGFQQNKRSGININFIDTNVFEYAFIDHTKQANVSLLPAASGFTASASTFGQLIDINGYPNDAAASGQTFGGGLHFPGADQFTGPYVFTWDGDGTLNLASGTWTEASGTYTKNSNGSWASATGPTKTRTVASLSGLTGPSLVNFNFSATGGSNGSGGFVRNFQVYRLEDETDLLAGKIFRAGFKQLYVDFKPSLIRFMDWNNVNNTPVVRFEHRNLPASAAYAASYTAGPRYGVTSGTNQMTLSGASAVSPFPATPVSMQHGEVVTCRIGSGFARTGEIAIASINKATGVITTSSAHGFSTNDIIIHQMGAGPPPREPSGMTQLDMVPCKVTVTGSTTYTAVAYPSGSAINMTGFSNFDFGWAYNYTTFNVGARGEYPVVFNDTVSTASRFGNSFCAAGDHKSFVFNKFVVASSLATGAWVMETGQGAAPLFPGVPFEICTAFMNELAAMGLIADMWVNIPFFGMTSHDSDYDSGSNWPVKMVDVIINGANGYAGLDSRCKLKVEHCNETWNDSFAFCSAGKRLSYLLDPAIGRDKSVGSSIRAVQAIRDIKAAFPGNSRIQYVLAGQGTLGSGHIVNAVRLNGNSQYFGAIGDSNTPLSNFDYWAWGGYFHSDNGATNAAYSIPTLAAAWLSGDATAKATAISNMVLAATTPAIGGGETTLRYSGTLLPEYISVASAQGKKTIMYEGGWDESVTNWTSDQNAFLMAVKRSAAWATALRNFHDAFNSTVAEGPADYVMIGAQFGHTPAGNPDTYSGGVEGASLDLAWHALKARNNGL